MPKFIAYIVWNEAKDEGYVTFDKSVAYEARKGAESNCFNVNGKRMKLAQSFCRETETEGCTIEEIEVEESDTYLETLAKQR